MDFIIIDGRLYRASDGTLIRRSFALKIFVERDATEFLTRNVTSDTLTAFGLKISDFNAIPLDSMYRGLVSQATLTKNTNRREVLKELGSIRTMAINRWTENSPFYAIYRFKGMSELNDIDLFRLTNTAVVIATAQLLDPDGISTQGLTSAMLTALTNKNNDFMHSITALDAAEATRKLKTHERFTKGNILFKEFVRLSNFGKELFHGVDNSKYEDYLIGFSHVSAKEEDDQFGDVSGNVKNGITQEVIPDTEIRLKGPDLPDLVLQADEDGDFEDEHVLTKYNSIEAVMYGFAPYSAPLLITPDGVIVHNIILSPIEVEP
ncbi:MAG: hypothetical protein WCH34_09445 [Bacteroidota bacterium]